MPWSAPEKVPCVFAAQRLRDMASAHPTRDGSVEKVTIARRDRRATRDAPYGWSARESSLQFFHERAARPAAMRPHATQRVACAVPGTWCLTTPGYVPLRAAARSARETTQQMRGSPPRGRCADGDALTLATTRWRCREPTRGRRTSSGRRSTTPRWGRANGSLGRARLAAERPLALAGARSGAWRSGDRGGPGRRSGRLAARVSSRVAATATALRGRARRGPRCGSDRRVAAPRPARRDFA